MSESAASSLLRPVRGLALAATTALALPTAVEIIRLFVRLDRIRLAFGSGPGGPTTAAVASSDHMIRVLSVLYSVGLVIAGAVFVAWLFRVRSNAEVIGGAAQKWATPMLIIGWIAPVANFWIPRRIINDVWNGSAPDDPAHRRRALINVWWACYLLGTNGGNLLAVLLSKGHAPKAAIIVYAFMSVFDIAAAILAGFVIWRIVHLQDQAGRHLVAVPADDVTAPEIAPQPSPQQRRQNVLIAVAFGALFVLAGLGLLLHGHSKHTDGQNPEKAGYAYGTTNSDPITTDCETESKRRYSDQLDALSFAASCLQAQSDALGNAPNIVPSP
jgi:hypothetical protein